MSPDSYVLKVAAVRRSIEDLRQKSIHPFFPAYLHLRQRSAIEGTTTEINPRWKDLGTYLEVTGAPAAKPFFRPFLEGQPESGQEWLNSNLAGSFAGSSLRANKPPMLVVDYDRSSRTFSLRDRHWELARRHLLHGQRVSIAPLFAFLLRDFAFTSDSGVPKASDVVTSYLTEFGYTDKLDVEVQHLYDLTILDAGIDGWFEPLSAQLGSAAGTLDHD